MLKIYTTNKFYISFSKSLLVFQSMCKVLDRTIYIFGNISWKSMNCFKMSLTPISNLNFFFLLLLFNFIDFVIFLIFVIREWNNNLLIINLFSFRILLIINLQMLSQPKSSPSSTLETQNLILDGVWWCLSHGFLWGT